MRTRPLTAGQILALCLLASFAVLLLTILGGCADTQQFCASCPPKVVTQTVDRALPCIVPIADMEPLVLAERPAYPGREAPDAVIDNWLVELQAAIDSREAKLQARIDALEAKIRAHNLLQPACTDIQ